MDLLNTSASVCFQNNFKTSALIGKSIFEFNMYYQAFAPLLWYSIGFIIFILTKLAIRLGYIEGHHYHR